MLGKTLLDRVKIETLRRNVEVKNADLAGLDMVHVERRRAMSIVHLKINFLADAHVENHSRDGLISYVTTPISNL